LYVRGEQGVEKFSTLSQTGHGRRRPNLASNVKKVHGSTFSENLVHSDHLRALVLSGLSQKRNHHAIAFFDRLSLRRRQGLFDFLR
jgi:hypothetical protein